MGIPGGEESEQGIENLFEEIMTENFPNLVSGKDTQVQEVQRVPNKTEYYIILFDKEAAGLRALTPIVKEVLWVKCYQTALHATEKLFMKGRVS